MIADDVSIMQRDEQAGLLAGARQQQDAVVGTAKAAIARARDLLPADAWQREWRNRIVIIGGESMPGCWHLPAWPPERCDGGVSTLWQSFVGSIEKTRRV